MVFILYVNLKPIIHSGKIKWHECTVFADKRTEGKVKIEYHRSGYITC